MKDIANKMNSYFREPSPGETARTLDAQIHFNKSQNVGVEESITWGMSYFFSRLIHETGDINQAINIMDTIISHYTEPEVYEGLYEEMPFSAGFDYD